MNVNKFFGDSLVSTVKILNICYKLENKSKFIAKSFSQNVIFVI